VSDNLGTVKIYRFDPAVDKEPHYDTFEGVEYEGRMVLDVLKYVYENRDPTLSFRYECRLGLCTICKMRVNGKNVFACKKLAEKEMVIDPPRGTVIKDLMIDMSKHEIEVGAI
jgi:succinate dehydrogenase/fumarate reductase iron-sulfur protein